MTDRYGPYPYENATTNETRVTFWIWRTEPDWWWETGYIGPHAFRLGKPVIDGKPDFTRQPKWEEV